MKKETKRRALYFFTCDKCGHKRTSRLYWRAKELVCLKCKKNIVPDNQQSLFEAIDPGPIIATDVKVERTEKGIKVTAKATEEGKKFLKKAAKLVVKQQLKDARNLEKDIIKIAFGPKKKVCLKELKTRF